MSEERMSDPRGFSPVTEEQARSAHLHCLQCSLEAKSLALELDLLANDPEGRDGYTATRLMSGVIGGLQNLQDDVPVEVRDALARANPYPATLPGFCSVSFLSLTEELARDLCLDLLELVDAEQSLFLRAHERMYRRAIDWDAFPDFEVQHVARHLDRMRLVVKKYEPLGSELLRLNVLKEIDRVLLQSMGKTLPSGGANHENNDRDSWMYQQRIGGLTVAEVRGKPNREHPEWNSLDTDQGVTVALCRFATREGLPWPIGPRS